jgi:hypothetical protein
MAERGLGVRTVQTAEDARALARELAEAVTGLSAVLSEETDLLKRSEIKAATLLAERKSEAGRRYVAALESVKVNAVALARWAPAEVTALKQSQAGLNEAIDLNMTVLATAKAVSENIVRSLAREIAAPKRLDTYAMAGTMASPAHDPRTGPLVLSRRL